VDLRRNVCTQVVEGPNGAATKYVLCISERDLRTSGIHSLGGVPNKFETDGNGSSCNKQPTRYLEEKVEQEGNDHTRTSRLHWQCWQPLHGRNLG